MKVFIVHYHKLADRKVYMKQQLEQNLLDGHFVEQYDRDTISESDLEIFDNGMKLLHRRPFAAVFLSHLYCYEQDFETALILEDDAILAPNFSNTLRSYISQLPDEWDMVFLGDACNFHIPNTTPSKNVYLKGGEPTSWGGHGATRAADSYMITRKCADRIANFARQGNVFHMIDHWLNHAIRVLDLKVYWAEPTIVKSGSENGIFNRSVSVNFG